MKQKLPDDKRQTKKWQIPHTQELENRVRRQAKRFGYTYIAQFCRKLIEAYITLLEKGEQKKDDKEGQVLQVDKSAKP